MRLFPALYEACSASFSREISQPLASLAVLWFCGGTQKLWGKHLESSHFVVVSIVSVVTSHVKFIKTSVEGKRLV